MRRTENGTAAVFTVFPCPAQRRLHGHAAFYLFRAAPAEKHTRSRVAKSSATELSARSAGGHPILQAEIAAQAKFRNRTHSIFSIEYRMPVPF